MTKLLGTSLVGLGITLLIASGCGGASSDEPNAGGSSGSAAHTGGSGGSTGGAHIGGGGSSGSGGAHQAGAGEGGAGEGGAGEGGAGECPMETFDVKWRDIRDTACSSEGLVCHKGSDTCDVGTLVASTETLACRDGKWDWSGYNERWCCPNLPRFADSDGTACRDEGHICYENKAHAACEPLPIIVCTSGTWQLDTQIPGECGGASGGGAGGQGGAGGNGG